MNNVEKTNALNKPRFLIVWVIISILALIIQLGFVIADILSNTFSSLPEIANDLGVVVIQTDLFIGFTTFTIICVFLVGLLRIKNNEVTSGVTFIVAGVWATTVMGMYFVTLNFADLMSAVIGTLGEEAEPFGWSFKLYITIITGILVSPNFYSLKYVKMKERLI